MIDMFSGVWCKERAFFCMARESLVRLASSDWFVDYSTYGFTLRGLEGLVFEKKMKHNRDSYPLLTTCFGAVR